MLLVGNGGALINLLFGFSLIQALPTLFSNAASDAVKRAVYTTIPLSIAAILSMLYLAVALFSARDFDQFRAYARLCRRDRSGRGFLLAERLLSLSWS